MAIIIGSTTVATGGTAVGGGATIAGTIAAKMVHKALVWKILAGAGADIGVVGVGALILASGGTAEEICNPNVESIVESSDLTELIGIDSIESVL